MLVERLINVNKVKVPTNRLLVLIVKRTQLMTMQEEPPRIEE
jgi:hypothetical protein